LGDSVPFTEGFQRQLVLLDFGITNCSHLIDFLFDLFLVFPLEFLHLVLKLLCGLFVVLYELGESPI